MAQVAKSYYPNAKLCLVTDHQEMWPNFPGTLIGYSSNNRTERFQEFAERNRELEGISGGYWLYTMERIFALQSLVGVYEFDQPVIHIESDVFTFLTPRILEFLLEHYSQTSIPRYSLSRGIGSFIFAPKLEILSRDLIDLENLLIQNPKIDNDMDLLGLALNTGILSELPSFLDIENPKHLDRNLAVLFDGLAFGQYLLGQDPLHTNGKILTGFVNEEFGSDLTLARFEIGVNDWEGHILVISGKTKYILVNLHVHSKLLAPNLIENEAFWRKVIDSANSSVSIILGEGIPDLIHQQKISIRNKLRRARKIGYFEYLKRVLRNKLRKL
jgi:hypothetical protein